MTTVKRDSPSDKLSGLL